jgi:uncharacterized Fe-S cluster-containing MiaB family protein
MEANNTLAMRKSKIKYNKSSIECYLVLKTLFLHKFPNINKTLKTCRFGAFEKCLLKIKKK